MRQNGCNLLHVAQDVLPAVKHSSALLRVQLVDKVSGEVLVAVLVSGKHKQTNRDVNGNREHPELQNRGAASPQH